MDALNFIVNKDLLMDYATIAKVEELKTTPICKGTRTLFHQSFFGLQLKTTSIYKGTRTHIRKYFLNHQLKTTSICKGTRTLQGQQYLKQ